MSRLNSRETNRHTANSRPMKNLSASSKADCDTLFRIDVLVGRDIGIVVFEEQGREECMQNSEKIESICEEGQG